MSNPSFDADPLASPSPPDVPSSADASAPWYYAIEDQRHGPVSLEAIRGMLQRGELAPDDLVWCAGMSDWTPAMDIEGMVDATAAPPIDIDPEVPPGGPPPSLRAKEKLREASVAATATAVKWSHWLHDHVETRTWVMVGLLLTLFARGCDSVADKNVQRMAAIAAVVEAEWDADYDQELVKRKQEIAALESRGGKRAELAELNDSLDEFKQQQQDLRAELRADEWKQMSDAAQLAAHRYAIHSYWRQWLLFLGTAVLTFSLGAVAISDRTPDRWVAMMMLGIVLWSLLIGGEGW